MIDVRMLTKRYGSTLAVAGLTFSVPEARVTGFLGPNGAGKSTVMRVLLGLDAPTSGQALVLGRSYATMPRPMREVGALLDANAVHPGRTAWHHVWSIAQTNQIARSRARAVMEQVGLTRVASKRVGGFSLGMRQRLGIAVALLGDPKVLLLDEPANGLDPEGMVWFRGLMRSLAAEGRTVLVSSHLMSEMEQTADHLIVIGGGRLLADTALAELTALGTSLEDAYLRLTQHSVRFESGGRQVAVPPAGRSRDRRHRIRMDQAAVLAVHLCQHGARLGAGAGRCDLLGQRTGARVGVDVGCATR